MALFERPTSALLYGSPGSLLNWVALAHAMQHAEGYFWTDVRMEGQGVDPLDPIAQSRIPADLLDTIEPGKLARTETPAESVLATVVRADEPPTSLRRLADFLALPSHTQRLVSSRSSGEGPPLLVLSNGQRLAPLYPVETVGPTIRAITDAGCSLLMTYADEPPKGRLQFDEVWQLKGSATPPWGSAVLRVEKGTYGSHFEPGGAVSLRDLPSIASILSGVREGPGSSR